MIAIIMPIITRDLPHDDCNSVHYYHRNLPHDGYNNVHYHQSVPSERLFCEREPHSHPRNRARTPRTLCTLK